MDIGAVFDFWIGIFSTCFSWAFNLVINKSPKITLGMFLLACAFIGVVIHFILGTDFFLPFVSKTNNIKTTNNNGYQSKNVGKE